MKKKPNANLQRRRQWAENIMGVILGLSVFAAFVLTGWTSYREGVRDQEAKIDAAALFHETVKEQHPQHHPVQCMIWCSPRRPAKQRRDCADELNGLEHSMIDGRARQNTKGE